MKKISATVALALLSCAALCAQEQPSGFVLTRTQGCKFFAIYNTDTKSVSVMKYVSQYNPRSNDSIVGSFDQIELQTVFDVNTNKFSIIMVIAPKLTVEGAATLTTMLCYE